MSMAPAVRAGSIDDLQREGRLLTKVGSLPVLVVWHEGRPFAIEDRCPHLGFPLHQGTVEDGLVTCHWHHARFDLASGCTLDPWADDAIGFDVALEDGDGARRGAARADPVGRLRRRLQDGLEQRHHAGDGQGRPSGCWRREGRRRSSAPALDFGTDLPGRRVGLRASPCWSPWPTSCPRSTRRPAAGPRPWRWPSSAGTPGAAHPASRTGASATASHDLDQVARRGTGASSRPARPTRPNGRWPRSSTAGDLRRGRADDVRGRDRPRLHRRGPHAGLHQQGVRGASPSSAGSGRGSRDLARPPDLRRPTAARRAASGTTRTTWPP